MHTLRFERRTWFRRSPQTRPPLGSRGYAAEFDAIFGRIRERKLTWWADPAQRRAGEVNDHDGGRGLYFEDPNGHLLEIITRSYGSGGWNP